MRGGLNKNIKHWITLHCSRSHTITLKMNIITDETLRSENTTKIHYPHRLGNRLLVSKEHLGTHTRVTRTGTMATKYASLVPRCKGGRGERVSGSHRLHMCFIATWTVDRHIGTRPYFYHMAFAIIMHMRKQCVPGALSPPPPPHLGTRLPSILDLSLAVLCNVTLNDFKNLINRRSWPIIPMQFVCNSTTKCDLSM